MTETQKAQIQTNAVRRWTPDAVRRAEPKVDRECYECEREYPQSQRTYCPSCETYSVQPKRREG